MRLFAATSCLSAQNSKLVLVCQDPDCWMSLLPVTSDPSAANCKVYSQGELTPPGASLCFSPLPLPISRKDISFKTKVTFLKQLTRRLLTFHTTQIRIQIFRAIHCIFLMSKAVQPSSELTPDSLFTFIPSSSSSSSLHSPSQILIDCRTAGCCLLPSHNHL